MSFQTSERTWTFWSLAIFLITFMLVAPYYKGLFNAYQVTFEGPVYASASWSAAVLLVLAFCFFRNWKMDSHSSIISVMIWLVPLSCAISLISAVSSHLAINELYIRVVWAIFFIIGLYFARHDMFSKILAYLILGSGSVLVLYGFMNWFGHASFMEAIIPTNRLSNVFQYPNTYAAYLIALLVGCLVLLLGAKTWRSLIFPALMLVPLWLSLLLTLSRGALLILPVVLVIYFLCIPWYRQILSILYVSISGVTAFMLYKPMIDIYNLQKKTYFLSTAIKGWAMLLLASAIVLAISWLLFRYLDRLLANKFEQKKMIERKNVIFPVVFAASAVIGYIVLINTPALMNKLPEEIERRIENTSAESASVYARNTFYKDALTMSSEFPVLGGGGGAWQALYNTYKSYTYTSAQAHNFYLQYLVESGWLGLVILLALIIYVLIIFARNLWGREVRDYNTHRLIFPMFAIAILIHSFLDFDMSYVYISALVFLTLGATAATGEVSARVQKLLDRMKRFRTVYAASVALIGIVVCFNAIQAYQANASFEQARKVLESSGDYNAFQKHMNKALKLQPKHPDYNAYNIQILLDVYRQTQQSNYIEQALELLAYSEQFNAYNRNLNEMAFALELELKRYDNALEITETALSRFPWDLVWYERAMELYFVQGFNKPEERELNWSKAFDLLGTVQEKEGVLVELPRGLGKETFNVSSAIALQIGKIHFYTRDFAESSDFLKKYLKKDLKLGINKEVVRWYLASLLKQGKDDEEWRSLLIAADPKEEEYIETIANSIKEE